jgi:hypothetical protein
LVFHVEGETPVSVVWGFLSGAISFSREDGIVFPTNVRLKYQSFPRGDGGLGKK